ncbi:hypothetical protein M422DRAFT_267602 [Sphaerobolus stellatus SS14]|uniref:Uncharacterized protein n=1 Tax=Sphaerobolus stellatus (strain SS14) TaxID=990650 RepID=A0A0C9U8I7_SPHS4|nr:hypothetical protein M422DRAFT_267602 [Sphaerobolus stellatus SS14]
MSAEPTCEPCEKPGPYGPREQKQKKKDQPKSSAQPGRQKQCVNLTLYGWMSVFQFMDAHPLKQAVMPAPDPFEGA